MSPHLRVGKAHRARCARCSWEHHLAQAEWNFAGRGETELQQLDRHFTELLQELRVAQTGVQILFAFLLGLAFTPRFPEMGTDQRMVYLTTLVLAATSTALLIAPVSYHRMVFRRRLRSQLVTTADRYVRVGLLLLLLALVGAVHLAASFVLGPDAAVLAVTLAAVFAGAWYLVPLVHRIRHRHVPETCRIRVRAMAAPGRASASSPR